MGVKVNEINQVTFVGVWNPNRLSASGQGYPFKRTMRTDSEQMRGKTGGKAWIGGLARSGLAAYQACRAR